MANYGQLLKSLAAEYDVNLGRTKTAVIRSFNAVLREVYRTDLVNIFWDDDFLDIVIRKGLDDVVISPDDIPPGVILRIKKLIHRNMIIQKYDTMFQAVKIIEGKLIKGFIEEKKKDYIRVNYNDYPCIFFYHKIYQPQGEIDLYKTGQTYLFYVLRVELILKDKPDKPLIRVVLSRKDKRIPEVFIKNETDIDAICLKRIPNYKAVIETEDRIPFTVLEKYSKEFKEKIDVQLVRKE
jgi:hypothetical protein